MDRKLYSIVLVLLCCFFFLACGNGGNQENKQDSLQKATLNNAPQEMATVTPDTISADSRSVIDNIRDDITLRINMAKLAMETSKNDGVKNLAKTIVDQQTELNNKLTDIASEKNIRFSAEPTPGMQSVIDTYKNKGSGFDESYLDWVVKSSENTLRKYEKQGPASTLDDLQKFMKNAIPILIQHHDAANALKKSLK